MDLNTYFYNEKHERIASIPGMIPVSKGTLLVLRGGGYIVDEVQIHLNNHDELNSEELGFRVFCKANV